MELRRGISSHTLQQAHKASTGEQRQHMRHILRAHVQDDELLEILLQEHNLEKIKHRLDHTITLQGRITRQDGIQVQGELATIRSIGTKTAQQVLNELQGNINTGEDVKEGSPEIRRKFELQGYQWTHQHTGRYQWATLHTTFRKG